MQFLYSSRDFREIPKMCIIPLEENERGLTLWRLAPHARCVPIPLCEAFAFESDILMSGDAPKEEEKYKP